MPVSDLERAIRNFQNRILKKERREAGEMVRAYFGAWKRVREKLDKLQADYERATESGEMVNQNWIYQNSRFLDLQELIGKEMLRFGALAEERITQEQKQAIAESLEFSRDMMILQLGPEYDVPGALRVRTLPTRAIETMVGVNQVGSPLNNLFRNIPGAAVRAASDALIEGIILGYNPRKIAPMVRDALGVQLNRALTISRTETLRAYREAAHQSYEANADILKGWRWQAALSGNTCAVCISLHGREFPLSEKMSSHPNCRCCSIPLTISWEELGERSGIDLSGIDESGPSFEEIAKKYNLTPDRAALYRARKGSGIDYFTGLSPEDQIQILGKGRWTAWKDGIIDLDGIVKDTWSAEWGAGKTIVSLKEMLEPAEIQYYQKIGSEYLKIITSKTEATETAYKYAEELLNKYKKAEPELTALLEKLVGEQGGRMAGLEFRLKSQDSLARKIASDALHNNISEKLSAEEIKDISRYTALFHNSELVKSAQTIEGMLRESGCTLISIKNTMGSAGSYRGLHYVFTKDGSSFELQFHTPESYEIKSDNHHDYEVNRSRIASKELKNITEKWMIEKWKGYLLPDLFDLIKSWTP